MQKELVNRSDTSKIIEKVLLKLAALATKAKLRAEGDKIVKLLPLI